MNPVTFWHLGVSSKIKGSPVLEEGTIDYLVNGVWRKKEIDYSVVGQLHLHANGMDLPLNTREIVLNPFDKMDSFTSVTFKGTVLKSIDVSCLKNLTDMDLLLAEELEVIYVNKLVKDKIEQGIITIVHEKLYYPNTFEVPHGFNNFIVK